MPEEGRPAHRKFSAAVRDCHTRTDLRLLR